MVLTLVEEHYSGVVECWLLYNRYFVPKMLYEPDLIEIELVEDQLVEHRTEPLQKMGCVMKQNKMKVFFLTKCTGAIEYERHCSSASNHRHKSAKRGMVYKHQ